MLVDLEPKCRCAEGREDRADCEQRRRWGRGRGGAVLSESRATRCVHVKGCRRRARKKPQAAMSMGSDGLGSCKCRGEGPALMHGRCSSLVNATSGAIQRFPDDTSARRAGHPSAFPGPGQLSLSLFPVCVCCSFTCSALPWGSRPFPVHNK